MITVALIEDNRMMREGITALLNGTDDGPVVAAGEALDIPTLKVVDPEVVLIDVGANGGNSLDIVRTVARELPTARMIMMDLLPHSEEVSAFVHEGAAGFIMKAATLEDMVATIQEVADGLKVLPDELTSVLFDQIADDTVSWHEQQARVEIPVAAVRSHAGNVLEKLALFARSPNGS